MPLRTPAPFLPGSNFSSQILGHGFADGSEGRWRGMMGKGKEVPDRLEAPFEWEVWLLSRGMGRAREPWGEHHCVWLLEGTLCTVPYVCSQAIMKVGP